MKINAITKRTVSIIIAVIMIISIIPIGIYAEEEAALGVSSFSEDELYNLLADENSHYPSQLLENLQLRSSDVPEYLDEAEVKSVNAVMRLKDSEDSLSSCLYLNNDGSYTEYFFEENIKYVSENGMVKDKSNELTSSLKNVGYINKENDITVRLPYLLNKITSLSLTDGYNTISLVPSGTAKSSSAGKLIESDGIKNCVVYESVFEKADLKYYVEFSGVKEKIIISEKNGIYEYVFTISTDGLLLKQEGNGGVFFNREGEEVANLSNLYVYDTNFNEISGSVEIKTITEGETYEYVISLDKEAMENEHTAYPVTIDPSVVFAQYKSMYDTEVSSNSTMVNPNKTNMAISYISTSGVSKRVFVKCNSLYNKAVSLEATDIRGVYYYAYDNLMYSNAMTIRSHLVTESWNTSATTVSSTMFNAYNSSGNYSGTYTVGASMTPCYHAIPITNICKQWSLGSANYGFVLKVSDESGTNKSFALPSIEHASTTIRPYIRMNYYSDVSYTANVKDGLYKMKNAVSNTYITKTKASATASPTVGLQSNYTAVGSTDLKSQFIALHFKTAGNTYSLSFINSRTENSNYYLKLSCVSNVYSLQLEASSSPPNYGAYEWYMIYNTADPSCVFINVGNPQYYLSSGIGGDYAAGSDRWYLQFCGLDVPLIQQETNYYCGPASMEQILTYSFGNSIIGNPQSGETYQDILADILGCNENSEGTNPYTLHTKLNELYYTSPNSNERIGLYSNYNYNTNTINQVKNYLYNTMSKEIPAIIFANCSGYLPYYSSNGYIGHYICVAGIFLYNNVEYCILRDCCYTNSFFGEFVVTLEQMYNASVNNSARCRMLFCANYSYQN